MKVEKLYVALVQEVKHRSTNPLYLTLQEFRILLCRTLEVLGYRMLLTPSEGTKRQSRDCRSPKNRHGRDDQMLQTL